MSYAYPAMVRLRDLWTAAVVPFQSTVDVYLGPLVSGDPDDAVFVGYDGDPVGEFQMVTHVQDWAGLGQRKQSDVFDIHCCILTMRGVTDGAGFADGIERLYAIWLALTGPLKEDPSMGMGVSPWVTSIRSFGAYAPTDADRGVEPRIGFDVHIETRV